MLFNSIEFLFAFLPIVLAGFVWLNRRNTGQAAVAFLGMASIFFYGWWDARYIVLLGCSIAWNWALGNRLADGREKRVLCVAVAGNLALLAYYKYANFFVSTAASAIGADWQLQTIVLPLGISFFTFTQIAFLVDCYRGEAKERGLLNYVLFVTFFPHLIAGPLLHHKDMMGQFRDLQGRYPAEKTVAYGLFLLVLGLFKKIVIADNIARYVDPAFANVHVLEIMDAWTATVGYTLQLYFDFSAYSEMAMGIGMLFGIYLPMNFNSPYKAANIADFWKRWHMTLSRFLRDYLYIPLGGNRNGRARMFFALGATMLLGGLWHGAGWQFVVWGGMHGAMLIAHRVWTMGGMKLPEWAGRGLTIFGVMMAWVMFRAQSASDALTVWKKMFGLEGVVLPAAFRNVDGVQTALSPIINGTEILFMIVLLGWCMRAPNVHEAWASISAQKPRRRYVAALVAIALVSVFGINTESRYLYYQF